MEYLCWELGIEKKESLMIGTQASTLAKSFQLPTSLRPFKANLTHITCDAMFHSFSMHYLKTLSGFFLCANF